MLGIRYNSPVVLTFSLVCAGLFFLNGALNGGLNSILVCPPTFNISNPADYLAIVLYIFGHANMEHLLGNLSFLLLLGPILEEKYGSGRVIMMIFFCALITGILNVVFFDNGLLGASGVVFMFILLVSFANNDHNGIPLTFILILLLYVGKEVYNGMKEDNVSQFAHIAGGIIGSFFGFMTRKKNVHTHA